MGLWCSEEVQVFIICDYYRSKEPKLDRKQPMVRFKLSSFLMDMGLWFTEISVRIIAAVRRFAHLYLLLSVFMKHFKWKIGVIIVFVVCREIWKCSQSYGVKRVGCCSGLAGRRVTLPVKVKMAPCSRMKLSGWRWEGLDGCFHGR